MTSAMRPDWVEPMLALLDAFAADAAGSNEAGAVADDPAHRYAALAQMLGELGDALPALQRLCGTLSAGLARCSPQHAVGEAVTAAFVDWPARVRHYVLDPGAAQAGAELESHLRRVAALLDIPSPEAQAIAELFRRSASAGAEAPQPVAAEVAPTVVESFDVNWDAQPQAADAPMASAPDVPEGGGFGEATSAQLSALWAPAEFAPDPADRASMPTYDGIRFDDLETGDNTEQSEPDVPVAFDRLPLAEPTPGAAAPAERALQWAPDTLPKAVRELVDLLAAELAGMEVTLRDTLIVAGADHMEAPIRAEALQRCAREFERFGLATEAGGFRGLPALSRHLHANLMALAERGQPVTMSIAQQLEDCLRRVQAYLATPGEPATVASLVSSVADPTWGVGFDAANADTLRADLAGIASMRVEEAGFERASVATPDQVSLDVPSDVNPDLLDALLQEMPGHTEEFSAAIQRLVTGGSLQDVNIAQRVAHTLKGAGNTVGVRGIANLTHHLEDILLALARDRVLPTKPLAASLLIAADCLEGMSEALLEQGAPPTEMLDVLQDVLDWANRIDAEGLPRSGESPAPPERAKLERTQFSSTQTRTGRAQPSPREAEGVRSQVTMIRLPAALVDELLRLVGESIILTGQVRERVERADAQARSMQEQFNLLQQLGSELEQFIDVTDLSGAQQRGPAGQSGYDALEMDEYNELHTYSRRLVEAARDAAEMGKGMMGHLDDLDTLLGNQERLNGETQEAVMRTRMVPVKTVFPRLQRSVRQTCRLTGKLADLQLAGGETLMDSDVLQAMVDPLMHLLRNAIDHGIEDLPARAAAGKDESGNVHLEFGREGNNILIRCRDDGRGLNFDAIRETARQAGLLDQGHTASEDELKRYVLRPNFSTRSATTQTSGRGIGLDAVNTRVTELGGALALDSQPFRGCVVELRLPVSLISSHALLVRVGPYRLAVANRGVSQILHPASGELRIFGEERVFHLDGETYPVRTLASLLGLGPDERARERQAQPLLMVQGSGGIVAVPVDSVLESRDLVVKNLGRHIPKLRGLLGATILGDGSVTPVLDLPELLRSPVTATELAATGRFHAPSAATKRLPLALVVDDSLSARRSLAQFLQDAGYEVRTARDGLEAVDMLNALEPQVLLVDLEMPRMNGIELTGHVRSVPRLAAVPIIMITSRSAAKHRQEAQTAGVDVYLTKPFAEDELLDHLRMARSI